MGVDVEAQAREQLNKVGLRSEYLDLNRMGRLAPGQPGYSWASIRSVRMLLASLAALGLAATALALWAGISLVLPFYIAFLLALLGLGFAGGLVFLERDLRAGLRQMDGSLTKRVEREGRLQTRHFYVCVEPRAECFEVPRRVFNAMPVGGPYRVYFTPRFKFLVNVEALASRA